MTGTRQHYSVYRKSKLQNDIQYFVHTYGPLAVFSATVGTIGWLWHENLTVKTVDPQQTKTGAGTNSKPNLVQYPTQDWGTARLPAVSNKLTSVEREGGKVTGAF